MVTENLTAAIESHFIDTTALVDDNPTSYPHEVMHLLAPNGDFREERCFLIGEID